MYKITVTKGAHTRTGEARTAAGVMLAAINLVTVVVSVQAEKALPPKDVTALAAEILNAMREGKPTFTRQLADISVSVREELEYRNDDRKTS